MSVISAMGQPTKTWELFATVQASVRPTTGNETFGARVIEQGIDLKLGIRFLVGVNELMRVRFREKIYDIVAVLEWDMIQREQTLLCKTGVNHG